MLEKLVAESEIRQLIARYSDAVFRLDAKDYADCWTRDGQWDAFGLEIKGREQITAFWLNLMNGQIPMAWQVVHTLILDIDIASKKARGRAYVNETPRLIDGKTMAAMGVYHDRYEIDEDGKWRFESRRWDLLYLGPPDLTGTFHELPKYPSPPTDPDLKRLTKPSIDKMMG